MYNSSCCFERCLNYYINFGIREKSWKEHYGSIQSNPTQPKFFSCNSINLVLTQAWKNKAGLNLGWKSWLEVGLGWVLTKCSLFWVSPYKPKLDLTYWGATYSRVLGYITYICLWMSIVFTLKQYKLACSCSLSDLLISNVLFVLAIFNLVSNFHVLVTIFFYAIKKFYDINILWIFFKILPFWLFCMTTNAKYLLINKFLLVT